MTQGIWKVKIKFIVTMIDEKGDKILNTKGSGKESYNETQKQLINGNLSLLAAVREGIVTR
jgi:hypothetical protein